MAPAAAAMLVELVKVLVVLVRMPAVALVSATTWNQGLVVVNDLVRLYGLTFTFHQHYCHSSNSSCCSNK